MHTGEIKEQKKERGKWSMPHRFARTADNAELALKVVNAIAPLDLQRDVHYKLQESSKLYLTHQQIT